MHWNTATAVLLFLVASFDKGQGTSTRQAVVPAAQNLPSFVPQPQPQPLPQQQQQPLIINPPQQQQPIIFNPQPLQQQPIIFNPNSLFPTAPPPTQNPLLQLFQLLAFLRIAGVEIDAFDNLFGGIFGSSKFDFEDEGWYEASNDCWYKYFTDLKTYSDAQESCEDMGKARLASKGIRDNGVRAELETSSFVFPNNWVDPWIGLDDTDTEGAFIWSDGVAITNTDALWPSGAQSAAPGNGDCVVYDQDGTNAAGTILDQNCGDQEHYLCEYCPS